MVAVAFVVIFSIGAVLATQVAGLAENLPRYELTVTGKIRALQAGLGEIGIVERASHMLRRLANELPGPTHREQPAETSGSGSAAPQEVMPVRIEQPALRPA